MLDPRKLINLFILLSLLLSSAATVAQEDCYIYGEIMAEPNDVHPELGLWMYRMIVHWDTGSQYALSHFDLLIDAVDGSCDCSVFEEEIRFGTPVGSSTGEPVPCTLTYEHELNCEGDPSIDVYSKLFKFEPNEDGDCEPAEYGVGTFTFYSDLPPVPIAEDNLFLVDKFSGFVCFGEITGDFPGLLCNPVPVGEKSWGSLKSLYR